MALIRCPECNREISDTASACPNCGYNLENFYKDFEVKSNPLTAPQRIGRTNTIIEIIGSVVLLAVGVATIGIGIGIVLIILGVVGFIATIGKDKKYQYGYCPYCGTNLRVVHGNKTFKCPACKNVGAQTESSLDSTH